MKIESPILFENEKELNNQEKIKNPENVKIDFSNFKVAELDANIYDNFSKASGRFTPVGLTGIGDSKYDQGITLDQIMSNQLESVRAGRQGFFSKLANATLGGAATGAVGIIENFSNVGDAIAQKFGAMEDFERGFISQGLKDLKEGIEDLTPIYRHNRDKAFDFTDSGWYFEMLKGVVDSAVAFGFAGMGYAGIASRLSSTLGKATVAGKRLDVLTRAYLGAELPGIGTQLTGAFLSNYGEGTVMGLETYDETKEEQFDSRVKARTKELALELGIPESEVIIPEEELHQIEADSIKEAGRAGSMMRDWNRFLLFGNVYQMRAIGGAMGAVKGGGVGRARQGMLSRPYKKGVVTDTKFWKDQAMGSPLEAGEEIIQNVIQMESRYQAQQRAVDSGIDIPEADMISNQKNLGERLFEFAKSDQALLEGLMGAISGPFQYGITQAPFRRKQQKEHNEKYAKQQALLGQNAQYIKDRLKMTQDTEQLVTEFDSFAQEVLGRDPKNYTDEQREQDQKKFAELVSLTPFESLVKENLFMGTIENLEEELNTVINNPETDADTKQLAEQQLARMYELEKRFDGYGRYINGNEIFAAELVGERYQALNEILEEGFSNSEAELTQDIQSQLEVGLRSMLGEDFSMQSTDISEYFQMVKGEEDKQETKDINSVSDIVKAYQQGYTLQAKKQNSTAKTIVQAVTDLSGVQRALNNRVLQDDIKRAITDNRVMVNEAKTTQYQSLYADYIDIIQTPNEDGIYEINETRDNLNQLLENKNFKVTEKVDDNGQKVKNPNKNKHLYYQIQEYIKHLDNKQRAIENAELEKENEETQEVIQQNKKETKAKKKGDPIVDEFTEQVLEDEIVNTHEPDVKPLLDDKVRGIVNNLAKVPHNQRKENTHAGFINPATGFAEIFHTIRENPSNPSQTEISFDSDPTRFFPFEDKFAQTRHVSTTTEKALENKEKFTPEVGMDVSYLGNPSYKITDVLPNGTVYIQHKKTKKAVSLNPQLAFVNIIPLTDIDKKNKITEDNPATATKGNNTVPNAQVDNQQSKNVKSSKVNKNRNLAEVEALPTEPEVIASSNLNDAVQEGNKLESVEYEVDVIEVTDKNGTKGKESANVKTFDFNQSADANNAFNNFMNNGNNKEGVEVELYITNDQNSSRFYTYAKDEVKRALSIFNSIKGKAKNFNEAIQMLSEEDAYILMNYLPVKFHVKGRQDINSHLHVRNKKANRNQKQAEYNIRRDALDATLKGQNLIRTIKGQGPGKINTLPENQVIPVAESLQGNIDNIELHVVIDSELLGLTPEATNHKVNMTYTDSQGNTYPWTGIFTVTVTNKAGKKVPIKLNTKQHNAGSAQAVVSMLQTMVDPQYINSKVNVRKKPLKEVNKEAYRFIQSTIPTMLEVHGDNITLEQALDDMLYHGKKTKNTYGHIEVDNGAVHFGGELNENFNNKGKDLTLNYSQLSDPNNFNKLVEFIQQVKGFNVNAKNIKDNKKGYLNHVLSNYLMTDVDLNNPFVREPKANTDGNPIKRYESGHLYISSLPVGKKADTQTNEIVKEKETTQKIKNKEIETKKAEMEKESKISTIKLNEIELKEILDYDVYSFTYGEKNFLQNPRKYILNRIKGYEEFYYHKGSNTQKSLYKEAVRQLEAYDKKIKEKEAQKKTNPFVTPESIKAKGTFRGKPVKFQEIKNNRDKPVAARNTGKEIIVNIPLLQQKFQEKAWMQTATLSDQSKATPLSKNAFNSFEEFLTFVMIHEIMHDRIKQEEGETRGQYEDRINEAALEDLKNNYLSEQQAESKWEFPSKPASGISKTTTQQSVKPKVKVQRSSTDNEISKESIKLAETKNEEMKKEIDKCPIGKIAPKKTGSNTGKAFSKAFGKKKK